MILNSVLPMSSISIYGLSRPTFRPFNKTNYVSCSLSKRVNSDPSYGGDTEFRAKPCLFCGRKHLIEAAAPGTPLFPIRPSNAAVSNSDYTDVLDKFYPPRPDWYKEYFASVLNIALKPHEAEVAPYKSQIFSKVGEKAQKILEIGIGTGTNLKYYANNSDVEVFGIDPNIKMEKYARSSAESAGLSPSNFEFIHAVGEAIPLSDASVDAVVGTLVLCSVKDAHLTLKEIKRVLRPGGVYVFLEHVAAKDGTFLRFIQRILDPLQQMLLDGCQLTRDTGGLISRAGFLRVELNTAFVSSVAFINPHIYGVAYK